MGDKVEVIKSTDPGIEVGTIHSVFDIIRTPNGTEFIETPEGKFINLEDVRPINFREFVKNFSSLESLVEVLQSMSGMDIVIADLSKYMDVFPRCVECESEIDFELNLKENKLSVDKCHKCQ